MSLPVLVILSLSCFESNLSFVSVVVIVMNVVVMQWQLKTPSPGRYMAGGCTPCQLAELLGKGLVQKRGPFNSPTKLHQQFDS